MQPMTDCERVRAAAALLLTGRTGVISALCRTKYDPVRNFRAIFDEWRDAFDSLSADDCRPL